MIKAGSWEPSDHPDIVCVRPTELGTAARVWCDDPRGYHWDTGDNGCCASLRNVPIRPDGHGVHCKGCKTVAKTKKAADKALVASEKRARRGR